MASKIFMTNINLNNINNMSEKKDYKVNKN